MDEEKVTNINISPMRRIPPPPEVEECVFIADSVAEDAAKSGWEFSLSDVAEREAFNKVLHGIYANSRVNRGRHVKMMQGASD
jgi:hypothetical protein